ncbi:MAG: hypothetical protein WA620_05390, partial [Methylovirgula sp.]
SRSALMVHVAKQLRSRGSWCGETHLQKATYILQDLSKKNFGYKFIIYKHGPYSFELNSDLTAMRAANIFEFQFPKEGYGPSIAPTSFGERVFVLNEENIREYFPIVNFLTDWFAASDVKYLEKITSAYYITKRNPRDPAIERAKKLSALKPHVDFKAAEEAVRIVDAKRELAKSQLGDLAA